MTRVSSGTLTVVVFAILAGLAGAYIVRQRLAQPLPPLAPIVESNPNDIIIPVAAVDLKPGQMLTKNDIAIVRMSTENFAKSQYVNQPYMRETTHIEKRVLKAPLKRGDAFLTDAFYPDGAGPGIAEMLDEGFRAVTIPIERISAVQGFARPGSFVDVLFRSTKDESRPEVTITLLERVEVLAVNKNTLSDHDVELKQGGTVTLAVTPNQAKALKVVEGRGELSLTLRNPHDELDFLPVDLHRGEKMQGVAGGKQMHGAAVHPVNNLHLAEKPGETPWWHGMERVVQGADQVSLDDLLNIPPPPKPEKMVIYRGGAKQVVTFHDEASEPAPAPEPQMIRIPVERPFVRDRSDDSRMRTVRFDSSPSGAGT